MQIAHETLPPNKTNCSKAEQRLYAKIAADVTKEINTRKHVIG